MEKCTANILNGKTQNGLFLGLGIRQAYQPVSITFNILLEVRKNVNVSKINK